MKFPATYTTVTAAVGGLLPAPALAHWGHLGELAGHGHLVAVGLGAVAVAGLAGLAIWGRGTDQPEDEAVDTADNDDSRIDEGSSSHA